MKILRLWCKRIWVWWGCCLLFFVPILLTSLCEENNCRLVKLPMTKAYFATNNEAQTEPQASHNSQVCNVTDSVSGVNVTDLQHCGLSWRTVREHVIVEHGIVSLLFGALPAMLHVKVDRMHFPDRTLPFFFSLSTVFIGAIECCLHISSRLVTQVHWYFLPLKVGYLFTGLWLASIPEIYKKMASQQKKAKSDIFITSPTVLLMAVVLVPLLQMFLMSSLAFDLPISTLAGTAISTLIILLSGVVPDLLDFVNLFIYPFVLGQLLYAEFFANSFGSPSSFLETGITGGVNPFIFLFNFAGKVIDYFDQIFLSSTVHCFATTDLCNPFSGAVAITTALVTFICALWLLVYFWRSTGVLSFLLALHTVMQGFYGFWSSKHFQFYKFSLGTFFAGLPDIIPGANQLCWHAHYTVQALLVLSLILCLHRIWVTAFTGFNMKSTGESSLITLCKFMSFHISISLSVASIGMSSFLLFEKHNVHTLVLMICVALYSLITAIAIYMASFQSEINWKYVLGYVFFFMSSHNLIKIFLWQFQDLSQDRTYPGFNIEVLTVSPRFPFRIPHVIFHCFHCLAVSLVYFGIIDLDKNLAIKLISSVSLIPFVYLVWNLRFSLPDTWVTPSQACGINITVCVITALCAVLFVRKVLFSATTKKGSINVLNVSSKTKWTLFTLLVVIFNLAAFLEFFVLPIYLIEGIKHWYRILSTEGLLV